MRKLSAAVLIAAALGVGFTNAQNVPAPSVKAVQPGLIEVTGPYVNDLYGAGVQKLTATPGKGGKSIEVHSPWGNIYFDWPKDVKPVAFTIETAKAGGVQISAPGFTESSKNGSVRIATSSPVRVPYTPPSSSAFETSMEMIFACA